MTTNDSIQSILTQSRTIAVVGLSADPSKASYSVSKYMQSHGFRIIPVNPRYASVGASILGEKCYAELSDIGFEVDIVNVFRRTEDVLPVAQQAVCIGAKCLWQQLGVTNHEAHVMVQAADLLSVMDRCIKVDHARMMNGATQT
jgi:predicted CoA-binding protein